MNFVTCIMKQHQLSLTLLHFGRSRNSCFKDNLKKNLYVASFSEAATRGVLYKKVFLEFSQSSQENTCARASFLIKLQAKAFNFIKKEALAQVFFCEFCENSKNTFFTEHLWATASIHINNF